MKKTKEFKNLLLNKEIVIAPGAYDALCAKLIDEAGFEVIYVTGAGMANSQFCLSDVGLITQTEMLEQVRRIVDVVTRPLLVDIDTGYGGFLNVIRTVKDFEKAGVAGLQIEDQTFPKKCGHFEGKQVVTQEEMISKIKAAVDTRVDQDLAVIARTDSRAVLGIEGAIERAQSYVKAGADAIFVEAPQTKDEMKMVSAAISAPKVANMVEGGKTPLCTAKELEEMGYSLVIFANSALRTAVKAIQKLLQHLKKHGCTIGVTDEMVTMEERNRITALEEVYALERLYSTR